jgi:hypothetical protein
MVGLVVNLKSQGGNVRSRITSHAMFAAGVLGLVCSVMPGVLASTVNAVPELNPASITTGRGLLSAGVLILRARWRKK